MLQRAIVAVRTEDGEPDAKEIGRLTAAAGAEVVGEVTQRRPRDPGTNLGSGAVERLAERVDATDADTVVVDDELTPRQTVTLEDATGARVVDRHRVVLEIFAQRARTRRAQLQVELARLRYRLPRIRERADEGLMNRMTETGTLYDVQDRIAELERKLADAPSVEAQHREARKDQGFDLVALAGYTNAGKSTLLRRLADELSPTADATDSHADLEDSATVADRLFETLETTTRRATVEGRSVLVTDTVGFLDELPHWLVESFRGTLGAVADADAVVLVVDLDQPVAAAERKLTTAREQLPADANVVTALNKVDRLDADTVATRREELADLTPNPVAVSAETGDGLDDLRAAIDDALPDLAAATLTIPLGDDGMALVSELHDDAVAVEVSYEGEKAVVDLHARRPVVERAKSRAASLR